MNLDQIRLAEVSVIGNCLDGQLTGLSALFPVCHPDCEFLCLGAFH